MEETILKKEEIYCIIPKTVIDTIVSNQLKILAVLEKSSRAAPDITKEIIKSPYVTQKQAMKMLSRRATWFWNMRKRGLPFAVSHKRIYYKRSDILGLQEKLNLGNVDEEKLIFSCKA